MEPVNTTAAKPPLTTTAFHLGNPFAAGATPPARFARLAILAVNRGPAAMAGMWGVARARRGVVLCQLFGLIPESVTIRPPPPSSGQQVDLAQIIGIRNRRVRAYVADVGVSRRESPRYSWFSTPP